MNARVVFVTAPSREVAESIAETVVSEQLVACVNIIEGVTSIYRWQDKVQKDRELLLILKTTGEVVEKLEQRVLELHPYDTPEFVSLTPGTVESRYLNWLQASVSI